VPFFCEFNNSAYSALMLDWSSQIKSAQHHVFDNGQSNYSYSQP